MPTATVTSKGQITIPVEVRDALGLQAGDRVLFVEEGGAYRIVPGNVPITALKGIVPKPAKPVSLARMEEAVRTRGARKGRPS